MHRRPLCAPLAAVLLLVACDSTDDNTIGDPAGDATYFLDNQSDAALDVEWTTTSQLGGVVESAGPVAPFQTLELRSDSIIGVNPLPPDTFASLRVSSGGVLVYVQDPVDTTEWEVVRADEEAAYGHADITLTIAGGDLAPDYGLPEGQCCCEYLDLDIIIEDALDATECASRDSGQCVIVDPGRLTPHPCCPTATGDTCGP